MIVVIDVETCAPLSAGYRRLRFTLQWYSDDILSSFFCWTVLLSSLNDALYSLCFVHLVYKDGQKQSSRQQGIQAAATITPVACCCHTPRQCTAITPTSIPSISPKTVTFSQENIWSHNNNRIRPLDEVHLHPWVSINDIDNILKLCKNAVQCHS